MINEIKKHLEQTTPFESTLEMIEGSEAHRYDLNCPTLATKDLIFSKQSSGWVASRTEKGSGVHEPGMIATLLALRDVVPARQRRVFYDIGLLHGYVSLVAAEILSCKTVVGFEMNPRSYQKARRNFELNHHLSSRLVAENAGVADNTLRKVPCLYKNFALRVNPESSEEQDLLADGFEKAELDILRLDDFVEKSPAKPGVIKVDVEGSQVSILRGAEKTLKKFGPILLIETDSPNALNYEGTSMKEMCRMLIEDYGYELLTLPHRNWGWTVDRLSLDAVQSDEGKLERNQLIIGVKGDTGESESFLDSFKENARRIFSRS